MGIYLVMKNSFKRSLNHKVLFIATFMLPIILCALFGMVKFGKASIRVGILEESSNTYIANDENMIYDLLEQSEGIKFAPADEETMKTDLMTGKFHVILDYRDSKAIDQFELLSYQKKEKSSFLKAAFHEALANKKPVMLAGMKEVGLSITERMLALLMSLFMIFSTVQASSIIRDRQDGTLQRYQFARQKGTGYIIGCFLHNFLITLCQVLLCMVALQFLQKDFRINLLQVITLSIAISFISTVFSELICLVSRSEVQANITASAAASLFSILGGTFIAVEAMPGLLKILSFVSPIRWVVELIRFL